MTETNPADAELARERAVVADLYIRLDALKEDTRHRLDEVRISKVGGNHQARSERDSFARMYEDRLTQLRDVDARLVFGRLLLEGEEQNFDDEHGGEPSPASENIRYVGRIGLRDQEQRSLLIDWRAPQSSAFYQATAVEPLGVRTRRHLTMHSREIVRIDDDVFDQRMLDEHSSGSVVVQGEGALMAAVTSQRTGRMHDIVATIQSEQDRVIRADIRGALVVQGGPGTGKTAVALHRAAFLLYANRERLSKSGVLVVGPSRAFMRYIEAVLPSLGETGVVMQTVGALFPGVNAVSDDEPETAKLKGSLRMSRLISRAVRSRQRPPLQPQTITVNGDSITVQPEMIARAIARAQRSATPHNIARVRFVRNALEELVEILAQQLRASGSTIDDADRSDLREDLRTAYEVKVLLNTAWLPMSPEKLIRDLYARPAWLAELTPRWSPEQRQLLSRTRDEPFTVGDVPLLDEAAELLGPFPESSDAPARAQQRDEQRKRDIDSAQTAIENMEVGGMVSAERVVDNFAERADEQTTAERAEGDRTWTYGHVVVDEAQELSPMQWRLLLRRCPMRSFTIVGDVAQVGSASGARDWESALDPFFSDNWRLEELTVNYRTPAQIAREAERVALSYHLPITAAQAVREGQWPVETIEVADEKSLGLASIEAVRRDQDLGVSGMDAGTLAVIAPAALQLELYTALVAEFGADVVGDAQGLTRSITVLTAGETKGLEFDSVVLADPDTLVAESAQGASSLYVAMTRPTQRLTVLHLAKMTPIR